MAADGSYELAIIVGRFEVTFLVVVVSNAVRANGWGDSSSTAAWPPYIFGNRAPANERW